MLYLLHYQEMIQDFKRGGGCWLIKLVSKVSYFPINNLCVLLVIAVESIHTEIEQTLRPVFSIMYLVI